jgi:hypothetical protein
VLALALPAAGCSGDDGDDPTRVEPSAATWPGPPRTSAKAVLDVTAFNRFLATRPHLARSPLGAAVEFARLDRTQATTTSAVARTGPEGGDRATVVVTASGLLDDSVRAVRYTLVFQRASDTWRLRSARRAQRCWPNRGHQTFAPRLCR